MYGKFWFLLVCGLGFLLGVSLLCLGGGLYVYWVGELMLVCWFVCRGGGARCAGVVTLLFRVFVCRCICSYCNPIGNENECKVVPCVGLYDFCFWGFEV